MDTRKAEDKSLWPFFEPRTVAVIGASRDREKIGHSVLKNLASSGYAGKILPVNPNTHEILGFECYASARDIEVPIDLAVIVVPARVVPAVMEDLIARECRACVLITAGFKEIGSREGVELQERIASMARESGMRIMGPNCFGVINPHNGLNATFGRDMPGRGHMAFVSQSGALCAAVLDWALGVDIGFSKIISMGNEADLTEVDFMEALARDEKTKVILGYIEGVKDGRRFLEAAERITREKPIVLIKAGGTAAGARAAASHTGSLAGSEKAFRAAFKQAGIVAATSIEELFDIGAGFACQQVPRGLRLAIISNAGGAAIMASDAAERMGLSLPHLSGATVSYLREKMPPEVSVNNPVDLIGDADVERYRTATEAVMLDENIDGSVIILSPQAATEVDQTAELIGDLAERVDKPVLTSFMGRVSLEEAHSILKKHSVPNYSYPERAVNAFRAMAEYSLWLQSPRPEPMRFSVDRQQVLDLLARAFDEGRTEMADTDGRRILKAYGFRTPETILARTSKEAIEAAEKIGMPVVMKIAAKDILHKTDLGGVAVGLRTPEEIRLSFLEMTTRAHGYLVEGVNVQEMIVGGKEMILGMSCDSTFGPLLLFGLGGIYVETLKDTSFRIAPVNEDEARRMIREIRSYSILEGTRGEPPSDTDAIIEYILRMSQLVTEVPSIVELDINPLMVLPQGAVAVDCRMVIKEDAQCKAYT
jgi:acetyl coenzyme A synthetase (ADP forming)-like protein